MQDHIHIFLSAPPRVSPSTIAKWLRGRTAYEIFKSHPDIKHQLWKGHLWNPSYYVGTAGHFSSETIRRYIEQQKTRDW